MWHSPHGLEIHGRREGEGEEVCFDRNLGLLEGPKLSNFESEHERSSGSFPPGRRMDANSAPTIPPSPGQRNGKQPPVDVLGKIKEKLQKLPNREYATELSCEATVGNNCACLFRTSGHTAGSGSL